MFFLWPTKVMMCLCGSQMLFFFESGAFVFLEV